MRGQIVQQLGIGLTCIILGLLGWLPPHDRNILGFSGGLSRPRLLYTLLPKAVNRAIPRIIGAVLLIAGVVILIGTIVGVGFE